MQTCKTCRHWSPEPHNVYAGSFVGWGTCERASSGMDEPAVEGTLAWANDCEHYGACLNVSPDFGCVMHEGAVETVQEDDGA